VTAGVPAGQRLVLEAGDARLEIAPDLGGRIVSFTVEGRELLVTSAADDIRYGSFPMVPYAGRVRDGSFTFRGQRHRLPLNLPPHAIHGTVHVRGWTVEDERTIATDLEEPWPFAGRVVQGFELGPDRLTVTMAVSAVEPMPVALGWHPWFRRHLDDPAPAGRSAPAELGFEAAVMFERDPDGIASRRRVPPAPRPWDDCFTEIRRGPTITWPGFLTLALSTSLAYWVIYDETPHAICIEPQSAPPDDLNHDPLVIEAGQVVRASMTWHWTAAPDRADGAGGADRTARS